VEIEGVIRNKTFHDLRGTAITGLKVAGCTDVEIAAITGHSERTVGQLLKAHYLGAELSVPKWQFRSSKKFGGAAA
jgi:integrase